LERSLVSGRRSAGMTAWACVKSFSRAGGSITDASASYVPDAAKARLDGFARPSTCSCCTDDGRVDEVLLQHNLVARQLLWRGLGTVLVCHLSLRPRARATPCQRVVFGTAFNGLATDLRLGGGAVRNGKRSMTPRDNHQRGRAIVWQVAYLGNRGEKALRLAA
jgi:hypothetical protein